MREDMVPGTKSIVELVARAVFMTVKCHYSTLSLVNFVYNL